MPIDRAVDFPTPQARDRAWCWVGRIAARAVAAGLVLLAGLAVGYALVGSRLPPQWVPLALAGGSSGVLGGAAWWAVRPLGWPLYRPWSWREWVVGAGMGAALSAGLNALGQGVAWLPSTPALAACRFRK